MNTRRAKCIKQQIAELEPTYEGLPGRLAQSQLFQNDMTAGAKDDSIKSRKYSESSKEEKQQ